MEIRKADSKGRVSGFEPGQVYAIDFDKGYISRVVIRDIPKGTLHSGEVVIDGKAIMQRLSEVVADKLERI